MNKLNIKIILGSTRPNRFGIQPANWILEEEVGPSRIEKPYTNEVVAKFTNKIAREGKN